MESDVVLAEFDSSLGESAGELWLVKYTLQQISCEDRYQMALEVWLQFAGCCNECECQLFKLSVTSFRIEKRFAHIVDWELLALFFSYEHRDCEVNIELLPILRLGEEWG